MNQNSKAYLTWLLVSAILVFILSLGFAHAPQPFRRLGLSYAVFGIVCGLAMKWFATEQQVRFSLSLALVAALLVAGGGIHIGAQSYMKLKAVRAEELRQDPEQLAMLNMMKNIGGEKVAGEYEQRRRTLQPEFADYLSFRVSQLGEWNHPWPLAFWIGEVFTASLITGGLIFQARKVQSPQAEQTTPHDAKENS